MRKNTTLIAGALIAFVLAGSATARADETIRFATWDSDESLAIQQAIAKKFEEKHPGVKVQVEPYADGYDQKLVAAFGAGPCPLMTITRLSRAE